MYNTTVSVLTCTGKTKADSFIRIDSRHGRTKKMASLPYDAAQYNRGLNITEIELVNNEPTKIYAHRSKLKAKH